MPPKNAEADEPSRLTTALHKWRERRTGEAALSLVVTSEPRGMVSALAPATFVIVDATREDADRSTPCKFVPFETDSRFMRALMALVLCGFVVLVSGWTSGTQQVVPPTCSPQDLVAVQTPSPATSTTLYTRWCGPAIVRVHANGRSFLIRSG